MHKTIMISSCGTSLLTNHAVDEQRSLITRTANRLESELSGDERRVIDNLLAVCKNSLLGTESLADVKKLSAELNGIISYYTGDLSKGKNDQHFLLHSDTFQGGTIAGIVRDWLQDRGIACNLVEAKDLNTRSLDQFTSGMQEIVRWCYENLSDYRKQGWRIIFNLTGGFKSMQGFLQTLGMFYADEIIYIFESGEALLRIPRLPIKLDLGDTIEKNLATFRLLGLGRELDARQCSDIPNSLLTEMDGKVSFSVWGTLVWDQHKKQFYGTKLLEPLSPKIEIGDHFKKEVSSLPQDRIETLNKQLDTLAEELDSNQLGKNASLRFKKLKTVQHKVCTHEFYAWSDQDAKRVFGRFEDRGDAQYFVVERLEKHL
ncbi:MAG: putative CRISPR-associated protein [Deltaproteobacteria bacterium]